MKKLLRSSSWIALASCMAICLPAQAGLLNITCTATTIPVNFGAYDPSSGVPDDVAGSVTVNCNGTLTLLGPNTVTAVIKLGPGHAGSFSPRRMTGAAANGLPYNLYTASARNVIWGNGNGGSSTKSLTVTITGLLGLFSSGSATATVYGRIPPGQAVTAGTYTDTMTVTIVY